MQYVDWCKKKGITPVIPKHDPKNFGPNGKLISGAEFIKVHKGTDRNVLKYTYYSLKSKYQKLTPKQNAWMLKNHGKYKPMKGAEIFQKTAATPVKPVKVPKTTAEFLKGVDKFVVDELDGFGNATTLLNKKGLPLTKAELTKLKGRFPKGGLYEEYKYKGKGATVKDVDVSDIMDWMDEYSEGSNAVLDLLEEAMLDEWDSYVYYFNGRPIAAATLGIDGAIQDMAFIQGHWKAAKLWKADLAKKISKNQVLQTKAAFSSAPDAKYPWQKFHKELTRDQYLIVKDYTKYWDRDIRTFLTTPGDQLKRAEWRLLKGKKTTPKIINDHIIEVLRRIDVLRDVVEKGIPAPGKVFRGLHSIKQSTIKAWRTPGHVIKTDSFTSFSMDRGVAEIFTNTGGVGNKGKVILIVKQNKTGRYLDGMSHFASEKEVLIKPGVKYRTVSAKQVKRAGVSRWEITVEEIVDEVKLPIKKPGILRPISADNFTDAELKWGKSLSKDAIAAIDDFTNVDDIYIKEFARIGKVSSEYHHHAEAIPRKILEKRAKAFIAALDEAPKYTDDVYRGISLEKPLKAGDTWKQGYASSSTHVETANAYTKSNAWEGEFNARFHYKGVKTVRIDAQFGEKAITMEGEQEAVLLPQKLKVTSVTKVQRADMPDGYYWDVVLEPK